jgi:hypothetical protein
MFSKNVFQVFLAFGLVSFLFGGLSQAQMASPDAKLCKTFPVADVEAVVGSKSTKKIGSDMDKYNSCTVLFGGLTSAKIEWHQPGQGGLPPDVKTGLMGLTMMMGKDMKNLQTRDFGEVGCYQGSLAASGQEIKSTVCFLPKGYYTISVGGLPNYVPMESVKALLEKAVAAAR